MWNKLFGRKSPEVSATDLSWLGADMHSHLLPGIDDGSPDVATSIELIQGLTALGYKKFIAHPHLSVVAKSKGPARAGPLL